MNDRYYDERKILENHELAITDLLWMLLEEWRGLLAAAIILALLLPGLRYLKDYRAYSRAVSAATASEAAADTSPEQENASGTKSKSSGKEDTEAAASGKEAAASGNEAAVSGKGAAAADTEAALAQAEADPQIALLAEEPAIRALTLYRQWQDLKYYYTNSLLMKVDTSREKRLIILYYSEAEDPQTDASVISTLYARLQNSDEFASGVGELMGIEAEPKYIKELFWMNVTDNSAPDEKLNASAFTVNVIFPEEERDISAFAEGLTSLFEKSHSMIEAEMGPHSLRCLSYTLSTITDQQNLKTQTDAYTQIVNAETAFQKEYGGLEEEQKLLVDKVVSEGNVRSYLRSYRLGETAGSSAGAASAEASASAVSSSGSGSTRTGIGSSAAAPKKPAFKTKLAAAGFLLGIALYAAFLFLRILLVRRIRTEKALENTAGIRSFGGICEYPYTGIRSFFHDRAVYRHRHRSADADSTASAIGVKAGRLGAGSISLISLGIPSDRAERTLRRQSRILSEKKGIPAEWVPARTGASSIDEETLGGMESACIVLLSGTTTPCMAAGLVARLQEYGVPILGTEFLEL